MTNPTVNRKSRTIEVTAKFEKAAARFGSEEYNILQQIRRDHPGYKVVTIIRKSVES